MRKSERLASSVAGAADEARGNEVKLPREIVESKSDEVVIRIVRIASPPLAISEMNCKRIVGVPRAEWFDTLRRWKVTYRRAKGLHVALYGHVEAAIRAGATTARPGPAPRAKSTVDVADHRALLEASGFRRAQ